MIAPHVESLANEWIPSEPVGRQEPLARIERLLRSAPERLIPRAAVLAPPGAGSSLLVRLSARRFCDRLGGSAPRPRILAVRVQGCRGSVGVASELLRSYDPGFSGRGFSTAEVMAGFLRRMIRDGRGAVVVLDDIGPAAPDLTGILRALLAPDQFLPEGAPRLPPFAILLAVHSNAKAAVETLAQLGLVPQSAIEIPAYTDAQLTELLAERAQRALGRAADPAWLDRLAAQVRAEGGGAVRAIELLRTCLAPPTLRHSPFVPARNGPKWEVEPRLVSALQEACRSGPAEVKSIRKWERTIAESEKAHPLPLTTLWRRLVRLEELGLLSRQVRPGGPGGTRSMIVLRSDLRSGAGVTRDPSTGRGHAVPERFSAPGIWPAPPPGVPPWLPLAAVAAVAGPIRRAPGS